MQHKSPSRAEELRGNMMQVNVESQAAIATVLALDAKNKHRHLPSGTHFPLTVAQYALSSSTTRSLVRTTTSSTADLVR